MPQIFDCSLFFNENDVFEIRLKELWSVVDTFVVLEANKTFRGNPKPCYFDFDRFRDYRSKIEFLTLDMDNQFILPDDPTPWDREIAQRDWLLVAASSLQPDANDTMIFSDVDEIPRRGVVAPVQELKRLHMKKFSYGINMLTEEVNASAVMCPWWYAFREVSIERIRRSTQGQVIDDAGWEFSSLGTPEEILLKLKSFSHSEFDTPELTAEKLKERILARQDIVGRDMWHKVVEIDDTWPEAVRQDPERWRHLTW